MKLSVFLPTIRTHLLSEFCEFLRNSYSGDLEVVFAGPFSPVGRYKDNHSWFYNKIDCQWIQTFQSPTCAAQEAALACTGDLILHSVDDTLYLPGALDDLVETFNIIDANIDNGIVYNVPYCDIPEGYRELRKNKIVNPNIVKHPSWYWTAANAGYSIVPHIQNDWMTTCHFLMKKSLFIKYGGFDCQFEYLNYACHDLLFRMYYDDVSGFPWEDNVSLADFMPGHEGDHGPIHDAQLFFDHPKFFTKWAKVPQLKIDPLNYKNHPEVWERRFGKGGQREYKELYAEPK